MGGTSSSVCKTVNTSAVMSLKLRLEVLISCSCIKHLRLVDEVQLV